MRDNHAGFIYHCAEGQRHSLVARKFTDAQRAGCLQTRFVAVHTHAVDPDGMPTGPRKPGAIAWSPFSNLDYAPAPDEDWVIIGYRNGRGPAREVLLPWRVLAPGRAATAGGRDPRTALKQAANPAAEAVRRAKQQMFSTDLWLADLHRSGGEPPQPGRHSEPGSTATCRTCWPRNRYAAGWATSDLVIRHRR